MRGESDDMAARSTRDRIMNHHTECVVCLQKALDHLAQVSLLSGGRSEHINDKAPVLIAGLQVVIDAVVSFRDGL